MTDLFEVPIDTVYRSECYRPLDPSKPVRGYRTTTGGCRVENAELVGPFHNLCPDSSDPQCSTSAQASLKATATTRPSDDVVA